MRQFSKGFTLIEILIAVAILGILASVALPNYSNYVKRAKISEAVLLTEAVKAAMILDYQKKRSFPANNNNLSARNKSIGLSDVDSYKTDVIERMWVGSGGVRGSGNPTGHIAINLNPKLNAGVGGSSSAQLLSTIEANGRGGFNFICGNSNATWASTVDHAYLPKSCQN